MQWFLLTCSSQLYLEAEILLFNDMGELYDCWYFSPSPPLGDSGIKDFGGEVDDEEIFYFIYGYRTTVMPIDWEAVFVHCLERTFDKFCSKGNKRKHKDVQNNNIICDNRRTCSSNKSDKQDKPYLEKVDSGIGLESDPGNWSDVESDDEMSSNWASPQCSVSGSLRGKKSAMSGVIFFFCV